MKGGQWDFNGNANAPTADCIVQQTAAISTAPLTDDHSTVSPFVYVVVTNSRATVQTRKQTRKTRYVDTAVQLQGPLWSQCGHKP